MNITTTTLTYFSSDDQADMHICPSCAISNLQLAPFTPVTYEYDPTFHPFSSLCHHCDTPIIAIS